MATVRLSAELVSKITHAAKVKMTPAITRAEELRPDHAWGDKIYDKMFGELLPEINALPKEWFRHVIAIRVRGVTGVDPEFDMDFKLSQEMPWPQELVSTDIHGPYIGYGYDVDRGVVSLKNHEVWSEFIGEIKAYDERCSTAINRSKEFVAMVKHVLNAYSTLAPALKAWPPLWELIPEDVKARHREVVQRPKKEIKLDVDLDKLTAMSTIAKLGG
jgi:hypothetical protein